MREESVHKVINGLKEMPRDDFIDIHKKSMSKLKNKKIDSNKFITIFTDASYDYSIKAAGWAGWIKHGHPAETIRLSGKLFDIQNINIAEKYAIELSIKELIERNITVKDKIIVIQSDSEYALSKVDISGLKDALRVNLKHVKGHQGKKCVRSAVNTWCDKEARRILREIRKKI